MGQAGLGKRLDMPIGITPTVFACSHGRVITRSDIPYRVLMQAAYVMEVRQHLRHPPGRPWH
eukprot:1052345-Amphidinium_carterae.1